MGFEIFNFIIPYYGFMIAIGVIVSTIIGYFMCKKLNLDINDYFIILGVISLFSILGGKLLFLIVNYKKINFSQILNIEYLNVLMSGGFVFFGSLVFGIFSLFILKYNFKINIDSYIPIIVTLVPLAHGFSRIGCHCVGCCYGIKNHFQYIPSRIYKVSAFAPNNVSLFPVQFVESILNFLIFFILLTLFKLKNRKIIFDVYLIMYSSVRFILEYFRGDLIERGGILIFSTSQIISIIIIIFVILKNIFKIRFFIKEENDAR